MTKTIFFVDDDATVRGFVDKFLKKYRSCDTRKEFTNPVEVLKAVLSGEKVDLIITDGEMPEMYGADLASKVHYMGYHIPVILLTGNEDIKAPLPGVTEVAYKPVRVAALRELIERYLGPPDAA